MDLTRYNSHFSWDIGFHYQNLYTTYFTEIFGTSICKFESIITAIYSLNFSPKRTVVGGAIIKNVMRSWIATVAAARGPRLLTFWHPDPHLPVKTPTIQTTYYLYNEMPDSCMLP